MLSASASNVIDCEFSPTASTVDPLTAPSVAEIVLVPALAPCASPPELIVAAAGLPEAQVTADVRSAVEASEKVPVAVNG